MANEHALARPHGTFASRRQHVLRQRSDVTAQPHDARNAGLGTSMPDGWKFSDSSTTTRFTRANSEPVWTFACWAWKHQHNKIACEKTRLLSSIVLFFDDFLLISLKGRCLTANAHFANCVLAVKGPALNCKYTVCKSVAAVKVPVLNCKCTF